MKDEEKENYLQGRPLKSEPDLIPYEEIDRLLVHGEEVEIEGSGSAIIRYPSYRELASRYGVSHTVIGRFAKQHNCLQRRKQTKKRVETMADIKLAELRADKISVSRDDAIRIIDKYLLRFEQALEEDRVRCDNPTDYNTMLRLRSFILGDADSRQEVLGGITIEDVKRQHKKMVSDWQNSTPAMRGEVPLHAVPHEAEDESEDGMEESDDGTIASKATPEPTE